MALKFRNALKKKYGWEIGGTETAASASELAAMRARMAEMEASTAEMRAKAVEMEAKAEAEAKSSAEVRRKLAQIDVMKKRLDTLAPDEGGGGQASAMLPASAKAGGALTAAEVAQMKRQIAELEEQTRLLTMGQAQLAEEQSR